jgi:DNA polymerase-4
VAVGRRPEDLRTAQCAGPRHHGQLAKADPAWLARRIGVEAAEHLLELARGYDVREVESGERPKSIGRENTFAADLHDLDSMERELLAFADDVARRLRRKNLRCLGVTLKVRFEDFSRITRAALFDEPTDVAEPLYQAAVNLLRTRVDMRRGGVRLLGLTATRLLSPDEVTATLFQDVAALRQRSVAQTGDRLRARFGADAITRARLLEGREQTTGTPSESPPEKP